MKTQYLYKKQQYLLTTLTTWHNKYTCPPNSKRILLIIESGPEQAGIFNSSEETEYLWKDCIHC